MKTYIRAAPRTVICSKQGTLPSYTTAADASVAWPHRGTSIAGVNHRSLNVSCFLNTSSPSEACGSSCRACVEKQVGTLVQYFRLEAEEEKLCLQSNRQCMESSRCQTQLLLMTTVSSPPTSQHAGRNGMWLTSVDSLLQAVDKRLLLHNRRLLSMS